VFKPQYFTDAGDLASTGEAPREPEGDLEAFLDPDGETEPFRDLAGELLTDLELPGDLDACLNIETENFSDGGSMYINTVLYLSLEILLLRDSARGDPAPDIGDDGASWMSRSRVNITTITTLAVV
jgi:hypothetical protein